jgi:hypothetical protein
MGIFRDIVDELGVFYGPNHYPWGFATYNKGHPSLVETNIRGYVILYKNGLAFHRDVNFGPLRKENKLFEIPYQKIISFGGQGTYLEVIAQGQDERDNKIDVPILFTINKTRFGYEPDTARCNKIKIELDRVITKKDKITI